MSGSIICFHGEFHSLHPILYNSVVARNPNDLNIRDYVMVESPRINEYCGDKVDMIIGYGEGRLTVRSVKLFMDGALGSWGAGRFLVNGEGRETGRK